MKRKIYSLAMLAIAAFSAGKANAQCPTGRYNSFMFPTYTVDSVVYSTPYNLKMDIYQPAGDALAARPLVILAHGGSFVGGTRQDDATVVDLCKNLAKRGYVTASIDYRLGNLVSMVLDSTVAIDVVIKAISDGKAAVRFFRQDAATTNTYKIDVNNIYYGGNSAGAVLFMHAGYMRTMAEAPSYIQTALTANGGIDGNSGNAGYSSDGKAVINLAGALNNVSFINTGDIPSVNVQGDIDNTVPYICAYPLSGSVHVNLCGLGTMEPEYVAKSIYHMSKVYPGDGHVPWSSDPLKFAQVDSMVTEFLYNVNCSAVNVNDVSTATEVSLFPNPASSEVNIRSSELLNDVTVYDQTGRVVLNYGGINNKNYVLNTNALSSGMYLVKVHFDNENYTPIVKRIVIE